MNTCVLCGRDGDEKPKQADQTFRPPYLRIVRIWWDTSVEVCLDCWIKYRFDAMLAPIRFTMEYNRINRGEREEL
jgi:hypothetical protein